MLHITEDTPPDMLTGAMDLTVHLPNELTTKMLVKRSTPMMDLLVQITNKHQLKLTEHTLEALGLQSDTGDPAAVASSATAKVLPHKPSTLIGALDTQHVRVVAKSKNKPIVSSSPSLAVAVPAATPVPRNVPGHQPFESTFRLKVHLPRQQLHVIRVSPRIRLSEILCRVCDEKGLDSNKFALRHPVNSDEILDVSLSLSDYKITEVYLLPHDTLDLNQTYPAGGDFTVLQKEPTERVKQSHSTTTKMVGGGVFNLIFRRGKSNSGSGSGGSLSSGENRSISPSQSDDYRSATPPSSTLILPPVSTSTATTNNTTNSTVVDNAKHSRAPPRKRRPAPKPPQIDTGKTTCSIQEEENVLEEGTEKHTIVKKTHSRNSSDSSGYHEASLLSDHGQNTSLPRRQIYSTTTTLPMDLHISISSNCIADNNLSKMRTQSKSTSSLSAIPSRKKKCAPPPPQIKPAKSILVLNTSSNPSPVVVAASHETAVSSPPNEKSQQHQPPELRTFNTTNTKTNEVREALINPDVVQIQDESQIDPKSKAVSKGVDGKQISLSDTDSSTMNDITQSICTDPPDSVLNAPLNVINASICPPPFDENNNDNSEVDCDMDWQYQLPSPPKEFRDSSPPIVATAPSEQVHRGSGEVFTNPVLIEKLELLNKERQNKVIADEIKSLNPSEDDEECRLLMSPLTLEHLEKRKTLVYNRELSTSLKSANSVISDDDDIKSVTNHYQSDALVNTCAQIISNSYHDEEKTSRSKAPQLTRSVSHILQQRSTLPNFKITTYDNSKEKFDIFEDNTTSSSNIHIKSNRKNGIAMISKQFESRETLMPHTATLPFVTDSFTFPASSRSNFVEYRNKQMRPVARSKSHISLTKYRNERIATVRNSSILNGAFETGSLPRSNSLYDVSGLHSLEVLKMIQNKLNTPSSSVSNLNGSNCHLEIAPTVNMATWSERSTKCHKTTVLEDENVITQKPVIETSPSNYQMNPVKRPTTTTTTGSSNVSVKINGSEAISSENAGNVVIRIGTENHRKPLGDVNKLRERNANFIRFGGIHNNNGFDTSRVPVVRSVELKKPYKELINNNNNNNTSITHINNTNNINHRKSAVPIPEWPEEIVQSVKLSEPMVKKNCMGPPPVTKKPLFRINSYVNSAPIVRGFNSNNNNNNSSINNCYSWNEQHSLSTVTLPPKYTMADNNVNNKICESNGFCHEVNQRRRADSLRTIPINQYYSNINGNSSSINKEKLLQAIRDFGGRKGLKTINA